MLAKGKGCAASSGNSRFLVLRQNDKSAENVTARTSERTHIRTAPDQDQTGPDAAAVASRRLS